ncbi:MAG TPA: pilus assembly protein TadG-related protein [Candidatus Obscuribacterales bacterium]
MFKPKTATTIGVRSRSGSLIALIPAVILLFIVGIGAFAMDISHNVTVRTELQSATDAAALAGARDLLQDNTINNASNDALTVAGENTADGLAVSNGTPNDSVTEVDQFDAANQTGTVTVDGSRQIHNMFSSLFGHSSDTVNTHSVAQAWRSVTTIYPNQAFPMMVSLDTTQGNQIPLYQHKVGDTFNIYINSQQWKNAAWTGFNTGNTNANYITNAIDQLFGFSAMQPGYIPQMSVGDTMSLGNGVAGQKQLAGGNYINVLTDPQFNIVLPVMSGDPPYNQSRQADGYVIVHVNSVDINQSGGQVETFHVTIVKGVVKGTGGIPGTTVPANLVPGITTISAGAVKLVT